MLKTIFSKVAWVGRAASTVFGLALVLALMFGVATAAFGDNGDFFKLGKSNTASAVSKLIKQGAGPALDLRVDSGAPLKVNSDQTVTNLSADKLDGQDSSELPPRGYAHIKPEGEVDPVYTSKGVNEVVIPDGQTSVYCFDLAFTPHAAVGSPFFSNSAVVATVTPPNTLLTENCPAGHRDAAVKTYGSNTGTDAAINFQIVFE